ncbi:GNAT family N-acetyltransferase [Flavivirga algicola]|uniref:GNAT family N-acetyltransferase n=1 Tax=Flavivirga algicola TaxID=2729136 RepID=A0ABX1RY95_9FLAO|nr:GNAT family N-acetyltransferase [Flavivirga algicola]NMH87310.1 GNAT family N-acetyltransferase [Flavivirga algicola]
MKITNCQENNLEACASLLAKVYAAPEYQENWNKQDACNYLTRFYNIEPERCFMAIHEGKVIGGVFAYSYPWHSDTLVYIQELFVDPEHRKKGIAKSLLKHIGNKGKTKVWLVANENTSAAKFYEKLGFKKNGPYKFHYGEVENN